MAKKRKPARKKTASSSKKTRRTTKRAAPGRKRATRPTAVELRPVRRRLQADLALLETAEQNDQIRDAITRINTCLSEIQAICGPDMSVPLG